MKSIILITEKPLDLNQIADIYKNFGLVGLQPSSRLTVEGEWGWFSINHEELMEDEYDKSELDFIKQTMHAFSFAQLEYANLKAANIAILGLPLDDTLIVDNDHGLIAPIEDIRRRIQESEDWITANE